MLQNSILVIKLNRMKQNALCTIPAAKAAKSGNTVRCRSKFIRILAPLLFAFCLITLYTELEVTKNLTKWLYSENEVRLYSKHGNIYLNEYRSTTRPTKYNTTYITESMRQYGAILRNELECTQACKNPYINCSNIKKIKLGRRLGTGWKRVTFQGMFRGYVVAVKFSNYTGVFMTRCYKYERRMLKLRKNKNRHTASIGKSVSKSLHNDSLSFNSSKVRQLCVDQITTTSKQELYLSKKLKHPVLVKLLGYCLRNKTDLSANYDITKRQIVSVWEFGREATGYELPTWQLRIQQCIKLVDFLLYLEKLSLYIYDIKLAHFIFSRGNYKFIDFESFRSLPNQPIKKYYKVRNHMKLVRDLLLEPLLNISFPSNVLNKIQPLISDIRLKPQRSIVAADWMSVLNTIEELI